MKSDSAERRTNTPQDDGMKKKESFLTLIPESREVYSICRYFNEVLIVSGRG